MKPPAPVKILTITFELHVSGDVTATVAGPGIPAGAEECCILREAFGLSDQATRWEAVEEPAQSAVERSGEVW